MKYDDLITINGTALTKQYIQSLSKQERLDLVDPIFNQLRTVGWLYPDDSNKLKKEYQKLVDTTMDLSATELFNNSSLATNICKHFCQLFYHVGFPGKKNMIEHFNDDNTLKRLIKNRLGLDWLDDDLAKDGTIRPGVNEAFNLSFRMIVQGLRSMSLVPATSIFKPNIAKYMYQKYSEPGDTVFDYSSGWGGRLLGAAASGRTYIGVDPLTTDELSNMIVFLNLPNVALIKSGSEHIKLQENSIDFSFSSPPYFNQEYYSTDLTQAYNNGEDYFYNTYWRNTLDNVKYMLKPGKWFGLNVKNFPKMVTMAEETFGPIIEQVGLRTVKSHLTKTKTSGAEKLEYIYMFKNNK